MRLYLETRYKECSVLSKRKAWIAYSDAYSAAHMFAAIFEEVHVQPAASWKVFIDVGVDD